MRLCRGRGAGATLCRDPQHAAVAAAPTRPSPSPSLGSLVCSGTGACNASAAPLEACATTRACAPNPLSLPPRPPSPPLPCPAVGQVQDVGLIFLSAMATSIAGLCLDAGRDAATALGTSLLTMSIATFFTGAMTLLVGAFVCSARQRAHCCSFIAMKLLVGAWRGPGVAVGVSCAP